MAVRLERALDVCLEFVHVLDVRLEHDPRSGNASRLYSKFWMSV